ncbi:pentapeptide repeat-containing protein [Rubritalea spongiae]|uniref:Pentapeptide repeat-containing protein n=1 Tax=Rubritalea spongiae TaxID=430797 RepID=A0ABW5E0I9_9BACT
MNIDSSSPVNIDHSTDGDEVGLIADELISFLVILPVITVQDQMQEGALSGRWQRVLNPTAVVCAEHLREHEEHRAKISCTKLSSNDLDVFIEKAAKHCGVFEKEVNEELVIDWAISAYLEWTVRIEIHESSQYGELQIELHQRMGRILGTQRSHLSESEPLGPNDEQWDAKWCAYVAGVQHRYSEKLPALGYSLEQVYQDVRAVYLGEDEELGEGETAKRVGVKLCEYMHEWSIDREAKHHKLAVIGDRGVGKSTFSTVFVARHAMELRKQGLVVINLPVDRLKLSHSVEAGLSSYCLNHLRFEFSPVDISFLKKHRVLLLLDRVQHLDDKPCTDRMGGNDFVQQACLMSDRLNTQLGSSRIHLAFVGMPSIAKSHAEAFRGEALLEILPFSQAGEWKRWWPSETQGGFSDVDQNEQWWDKWSDVTGNSLSDPRQLIHAPGADPLTCRPFFNNLIAFAYGVSGLSQSKVSSLKDLYEHVFIFLMRKFGGHQRALEDESMLCLEELAIWKWHGTQWECDGKELCTLLNNSELLVDVLGGEVDFNFAENIAEMARTFFKEDGLLELSGGIQKFLMWDYLIARRMLRVAEMLVHFEAGVAVEKKLHIWTALTAFSSLTESTFFFLKCLLREKLESFSEKQQSQWQEVFADMFEHAVRYDVPIQKVMGHRRYKELCTGVCNSETSLAIVLGAIAEVTQRVSDVGWDKDDPQELGSWLMRMNGQRVDYVSSSLAYGVSQLLPTPLLLRSLNYLNFAGQTLTVQNLSSANLRGAVLSHTRMSRSSFRYAIMEGAQMDHSVMSQVTMNHARMNNANLDHCDLSEARMQKCSMRGASFIRAKLANADLSETCADSCVFSWADLSNALLLNTSMNQARLNGAVMSGCSVRESRLMDCSLDEVLAEQVSFHQCELSGSSMVNAAMNNAIFIDTRMENVGMYRAELKDARFQKCLMDGVNLEKSLMRGASIQECEIQGASLNGVDFSNATISESTNLHAASLNDSDLCGTLFDKVNLEHVSFENVTIDENTKWVDCNLSSVDFNGVHLDGVVMYGNTLERSNFIAASLCKADLSNAHMERALMDRCQAVGIQLKGAKLRAVSLFQANLREANLSGASLRGCNLHGASLDASNMQGADLQGASLFGASLVGADLRGADLAGANLFGANFEGVKVNMNQLTDEQRSQIRGTPEWVYHNEAINAVFRRGDCSLDAMEIVENREKSVVIDGNLIEVIEETELISSKVKQEDAAR